MSVIFIVGFFYYVKKSFSFRYEVDDSYFKEFFSGIRSTLWARIYFSLFILRRLFSIVLVISLEWIPMYVKI